MGYAGWLVAVGTLKATLDALWVYIVVADILLSLSKHPYFLVLLLLYFVVEEALHRGLLVVELLVLLARVRLILWISDISYLVPDK